MNTVKLIHAADFHLDSPFEGLPAEKAARRRDGQRRLLERLAVLCRDSGAQLVLLAGDLFDSTAAYMETAEELLRALGSIDAPVFISPGNHDYYAPRSPYARLKWPENVHIFKSNEIECVELNDLGVRVYGAGFTSAHSGALLSGFSCEKREGIIDIMCLHGEVNAVSGDYNPISRADIAASGLDYLALGHIHKGVEPQREGETFYAWPGCPEGRGFDETGEKFVYLAEVGRGVCNITPQSIAGCRYETVNIDMSAAEDISARLPAAAQSDVYRLVLTGETAEAPDINAVRRELEGRFFALDVRDRTVLRRDVWEKAGEDTLRGLFLKKLLEIYDRAEDDSARERAVNAARWGLAALDNREEVRRHEDR